MWQLSGDSIDVDDSSRGGNNNIGQILGSAHSSDNRQGGGEDLNNNYSGKYRIHRELKSVNTEQGQELGHTWRCSNPRLKAEGVKPIKVSTQVDLQKLK